MKIYFLKLLLIILTLPHSIYSQTNIDFYKAFESIKGDSILKHLKYLASDELEGRGLGTKGIRLAANYISVKFREFGLKESPSTNNYFQEIPFIGSTTLNSSEFNVYTNEQNISLRYSEDYFLYKSGQQTFIPVPTELVFVGYGIVAPEFDYNDYQSVDVTGKVVVFLDSEPISDDPDFFNGREITQYSFAEVKRQIALQRGAAGTILIPFERYSGWEIVIKDFAKEDIRLAYDLTSNLSVIINPAIAKLIFDDSQYSFDDVIQMHQKHQMKSFPLKTKISFRGSFKERAFVDKNIIGILPGIDDKLKDSYLIISAHYDHLGIGSPVENDSIYNGTLDNAIGVSVLIELARAFSSLNKKPKRTIIFIAFTGEENGLLGSIYYTDNPVFPLHKTIANVNIDGIAFFRDFESVIGVGSEYSSLENNLTETAERYQISIEKIPEEFQELTSFTNSDQYTFASVGVPSIIVLEGLQNRTKSREEVLQSFIEYFELRYHTPFDDLNQFIDEVAAERHTKILFDLCYHLANSVDEPKWKSDSPYLKARLRSIAEKK
ncbi:Putative aminopeptidase [Ignavibacterium album JCM 16511]|uniref:Putative aminopeptidase n=1 Tax=Ignavibacterium album (strain DSM 19864 / JCM 16511 / NBRC 101810 / Mat9-16) TaxID=945713 RepID=I0AJR2_IGNAJ|nr:M28 family peptidase [Ignavibacterium album]AFH49219.1 Putative aminopeptidase [Ignavibacterium album JCM 16511]